MAAGATNTTDPVDEWIAKHVGEIFTDKHHCFVLALRVDTTTANQLRRTIMEQIPTVAIHHVEIRKNTSCVHDTHLVNRLGSILLNVDASILEDYHEGDKFSPKNSIKFLLRASAKDTPNQQGRLVSSNDLFCAERVNYVKPLFDDAIILRLAENEEINLTCYAVRGTGKEHDKWSAVSSVFYEEPSTSPRALSNEEVSFVVISTGVMPARKIFEAGVRIFLNNGKSQT